MGENRKTWGKKTNKKKTNKQKNFWPSISRAWLSHMWHKRGSNHSVEKTKKENCSAKSVIVHSCSYKWVKARFVCCFLKLTLVLLSPDISCICKQCRSGSVGLRKPTDLNLHCLPFTCWSAFISTIWIKKSDWLIINGRGILTYSAWQVLSMQMYLCWRHSNLFLKPVFSKRRINTTARFSAILNPCPAKPGYTVSLQTV